MATDYTLENQTVTLNEDLQILYYILSDLEDYDRCTKEGKQDVADRVLILCYRLETDLKEVKANIDKIITMR